MTDKITTQVQVNKPVDVVWESYTNPDHITLWAFASDDWHAPRAFNELRVGGRFSTRMEAKNGSAGFDFGGEYTAVEPKKHIAYVMNGEDRRTVVVDFDDQGESTVITVTFDPENINPIEMQKDGWQSILENFKKHTESL